MIKTLSLNKLYKYLEVFGMSSGFEPQALINFF